YTFNVLSVESAWPVVPRTGACRLPYLLTFLLTLPCALGGGGLRREPILSLALDLLAATTGRQKTGKTPKKAQELMRISLADQLEAMADLEERKGKGAPKY